MNFFNSEKKKAKDEGIDLYEVSKTEDYALISVPEAHKYIIVNQVTGHVEHEGEQLPTCIYQLDSLQSALSKLREEGKYGESSIN